MNEIGFIGLDVHRQSISVGGGDGGRPGSVEYPGEVDNDPDAPNALLKAPFKGVRSACSAGLSPRQGDKVSDRLGAVVLADRKADRRLRRAPLYPDVGDTLCTNLFDRLRHDRYAEARRHKMDDGGNLGGRLPQHRAEPGKLATRYDTVIEPRADRAREEDKRLPGQGDQRYGAAGGQRMVRGQHDAHGFFDERLHRDPFAIAERRPHKGDVEATISQSLNQVRCIALLRRKQNVRIKFPIGLYETGDARLEIGRAREAEMNTPRLAARPALDIRFGPFDMLQNPSRLFEQQRPGLGQFPAARQAVEERGPYLLLKLTDLQTQWRLLDPEPPGGPGEVPFLGNGHEVPKMPQVHSLAIPKSYQFRLHHILDFRSRHAQIAQ